MDEYLAHLETIWYYFPYIFYTFVLLTFLPKSLRKIKQFADADYEANRGKYHRCYGPELCCHNLIEHEDAPKAAKPRKAVSRGYLRKQQSAQQLRYNANEENTPPATVASVPIKRQVQVSAIQTNTNVNKIAKMFESGSGAMAHKKINRVLPEIRMHRSSIADINLNLDAVDVDVDVDVDDDDNESIKTNSSQTAKLQRLLHENIENSMNLLHQQTTNGLKKKSITSSAASTSSADENWQPATATATTLNRRTRTVPNTLTYAGTSATPSTASPAASSPHSSPSPPNSPILRAAVPPLNLKTSVEDIFAAIARSAEKNEENFIFTGCNTLSPVTSIDDILSQRRLSRPLSAYSISDLLNEESSFNKINNNMQTEHNGHQNLNQQQHHQDPQQNIIKDDEDIFVENLLIATLN